MDHNNQRIDGITYCLWPRNYAMYLVHESITVSNATKFTVLLTSGRSFRDKILFMLGDNKVSITLIMYISYEDYLAM